MKNALFVDKVISELDVNPPQIEIQIMIWEGEGDSKKSTFFAKIIIELCSFNYWTYRDATSRSSTTSVLSRYYCDSFEMEGSDGSETLWFSIVNTRVFHRQHLMTWSFVLKDSLRWHKSQWVDTVVARRQRDSRFTRVRVLLRDKS